MEVRFCDLCNESVPQSDLDSGRAVVRKGRVVCVTCDRAMSASGPLARGPFESAKTPIAAEPSPAATAIAPEPHAARLETFVVSGDGHPPAQPFSSNDGPRSLHSMAPIAPAPQRATSSVGLWVAVLGLLFTAGAIAVFHERMKRMSENDLALAQSLDGQKATLARLDKLPQKIADDARQMEGTFRREQSLERDRTQRAIDGLDAELKRSSGELARIASLIETMRAESASGQTTWGARIDEVSKRVAAQEDKFREQTEKLAELEELAKNPPVTALPGNADGAGAQEPAQAAWRALVADLASPNSGLRWEAVDHMGQSGDLETVPYLLPMLKDADLFVRMATARVLGNLNGPKAIPALVDALEDSESAMREASLIALHQLTGRDFQFDPLANEAERGRRLKAIRDWWKKTEEGGGFKKEGAGN